MFRKPSISINVPMHDPSNQNSRKPWSFAIHYICYNRTHSVGHVHLITRKEIGKLMW